MNTSSPPTTSKSPRPFAKVHPTPVEAEAKDQPTLPPPFDLEDFARERMGRIDPRVAPSDRPTQPAPEDPANPIPSLRSGAGDARGRTTDAARARLAEAFFACDYATALALSEEVVAADPTESTARAYGEECRRILEKECCARLGSLDRVPRLAVSLGALRGHALSHQAGFLVSRVDGVSTLEALLDVSAMPRLDALRIVAELVESGVLELDAEA